MKPAKLLSATAALLLSSGLLMGATYNVDPAHSSVGFKVKHLMISNVKGHFNTFSGAYDMDKGTITAFTGTIDANSIDTGIEKRDNHLRSADFFDVAKYPEITFKMTKFDGDTMTGDLTMHGVTLPVTLETEVSGPIKDPWGMTRSSVSLSGKLDRKDYGLKYNQVLEAGGVAVGNEIKLSIEIEGIAK